MDDLEADQFLSNLFLDLNFSIQGLRRKKHYEMNYLLDFTEDEAKILSNLAQKILSIPKNYPLSLKYLDWEFRDKMVSLGLALKLDSGQHVLSKKFWDLSYRADEN